ncbi:unnamed protein product [Paramecium primaurelia]|uniref:Uncharacterized protein n=1 Tax=Paramecium primaurelia TaxID=5886 RepID=A0A8S1MEI6_PARPR|nr:unnamed protein product [Paramecium primaurelia]
MQEQIVQNKLQKWMKNASQQKMNKITESKKYNKDTEKKTLKNAEEFMIELDILDQKQERLLKIPKGSINKVNKKDQCKIKEKRKEKFFFQDIVKEVDKQNKMNNKNQDQEQENYQEDEINQEEQKQEKENKIKNDSCWIEKSKKDCQDLSNIQKTSKIMIIQDDSDEKQTENTNQVILNNINGSSNNNYNNQIKKDGQNDKIDQFNEIKQGNIMEEQLVQKLESQRQQYENQLIKMNQQKHPKIQIQQNVNLKQDKKIPIMIVDAFMQTDDTSDIYGQDILNLILLEQNTVYQLSQLHEKILKLLNNQI